MQDSQDLVAGLLAGLSTPHTVKLHLVCVASASEQRQLVAQVLPSLLQCACSLCLSQTPTCSMLQAWLVKLLLMWESCC